MKTLIKSDMHVHTSLSLCAKPTADPLEYIKAGASNGLETIGFSNHYWDEDVPGASNWYSIQNTEHVMKLKNQLGDVSRFPLKVLFGCECEYAGGKLAITEKKARMFDYVLVPHSHTHMKGFVLPVDCDTDDRHADYLVRSFYAVATHELAAKGLIYGIVHPFFPCGKKGDETAFILSHITDEQYYECACAANENGIRIEINTSCFNADLSNASFEEYKRAYTQFKRAGCKFIAGSDKHDVIYDKDKDIFYQADSIASRLGL